MSTHHRPERVAQDVSQILTGVLRRGLRDPRVTDLTITRVRMSPDLRVAHINFVPLGGVGDGAEILDGLESASGFLRRELGRQLRIRHTPELRFHLDDHLDQAIAMTRLLDRLTADRETEAEE